MQRLTQSLFLIGQRCFNKDTLEIVSLEPKYLTVLKALIRNESIPASLQDVRSEIEASGILEEHSLHTGDNVFSPKFIAFRIVLGEVCNLKCHDCFVFNRDHSPAIMSIKTLEEVLQKTFIMGENHRLKYQFFGGEPLVMIDILRHGVEYIVRAEQNGIIQKPILAITTNGTLITEEVAQFLRENNFQVGISLDGPRYLNDSIRGQGVYDQVLKAFTMLGDIEKWFLITPRQETVEIIPDFVEQLAMEYNFRTITFNTPFDGPDLYWLINGAQLADMILECHERFKGKHISIESVAAPVLFALSNQQKRFYPCSISGKDVMGSISPDGRISFCAQYWGSDLFSEQFVSSHHLSWKYQKPKICIHCIAEKICGGPCPVYYKRTGKIDDNKCRFYQRFLEKFLAHPDKYLDEKQVSEVDF